MRNTTTTTLIRLPVVRAEQLRAIARAHDRTLTEQVEAWIHAEIAAGTISADLPGITISIPPSEGPTVGELLANPDSEAMKQFVDRAKAGAQASLTRNRASLQDAVRQWQAALENVARRGAGFVVVSPVTGEEMVMSQSILSDLKAQVERAAKAA